MSFENYSNFHNIVIKLQKPVGFFILIDLLSQKAYLRIFNTDFSGIIKYNNPNKFINPVINY